MEERYITNNFTGSANLEDSEPEDSDSEPEDEPEEESKEQSVNKF